MRFCEPSLVASIMINTANQAIELDCRDVKKLFMKLKDKGFFNRAVKIIYSEVPDPKKDGRHLPCVGGAIVYFFCRGV